jgi:hypothetical protein
MATVYIASICPIKQKYEHPQVGTFLFPAVARGEKPFIVEVKDKTYGDDMIGTGGMQRRLTEFGESIAADIIRILTTSAPGMDDDARPGIWIIGATPNYTPEQLAENTRVQANWLNGRILEVDSWDAQRRAKGIPMGAKLACDYLGVEREWGQLAPSTLTTCPSCRKSVRSGAMKCEHCAEIIDIEAYAKRQGEIAAAVAKHAHAPVPAPEAPKVIPNVPLRQQPQATR